MKLRESDTSNCSILWVSNKYHLCQFLYLHDIFLYILINVFFQLPRLKEDSMPNCPSYCYTERKRRPSREQRKEEAEAGHLRQQLAESAKTYGEECTRNSIECLEDIPRKLKLSQPWVNVNSPCEITICRITKNILLNIINVSIVIDCDLTVKKNLFAGSKFTIFSKFLFSIQMYHHF